MRYLSVFSGIEAASVAWEPLGWEPVAFCEIDEFPSAVLRKRYPNVPNLGDITKVDWSPYRGAVDLVIGGSPCQSFSIAGRREGLEGASGLMWEYIRCVRDILPEWFVWENVPGAFSVERGGAFAQLLSSLDELGYGLAWRVLDAQFFGVAQRRRRVFLVGHLGDMCACEVLFEPESLRWDSPSSREKRKELARAVGRGVDARSCESITAAFKYSAGAAARTMPTYDDGSCNTLTADWHSPAVAFAQNTRDEVRLQGGDGTRTGSIEAQPGKNQSYVMRCAQTGANGIGIDLELSHTLDTTEPEATAYMLKVRCGSDTYIKQDGTVGTAGKGALVDSECAYTVSATQDQTVITMSDDTAHASIDENISGTLKVGGGGALCDSDVIASNGERIIGSLCASDSKQTGNQFVNDGKVVACKTQTPTP